MSETGGRLPIPEILVKREPPFAEYARFALSGNALNPMVDNLPQIQAAELTHLTDTINKIAGATTLARHEHWQKLAPKNNNETDEQQHARQLQMWKDSVVAGMKKKGNKNYVDKLTSKKFAGIDYANFNAESAQTLYDRYSSKPGTDGMQEVVMNGEKMILQNNLALFLQDVTTTYAGDQLAMNADMDAILWLAGIFDIPTEANGQPTFTTLMNRCLETNYYLQPANVRVLTEQANKTVKVGDKDMLRINWLKGGDGKEQKELEFLWGHIEGLQQKKVKIKEADPVKSAVDDELKRISIDVNPDPSRSSAETIADYFSKDFNDVSYATVLSPEAFKETYGVEKPSETDPAKQKDAIRNIIATNIAKRIIDDPDKKEITDTLTQQIADALHKKEAKDQKKIYADHPEKYGEPGFRHVGSEQSKAYQKKGGWKLNLTVSPEKYAKVDEWLDKNYPGQYKLLSGGDPGQNDFTIYVGSKNESDEWAEKIKTALGDDLLDNNSGPTYRSFNDKVRGRFDIQATGSGSWYYGFDGIPYDKEAKDAEYQVNYAKRTNNAAHRETWEQILAQHQKRIEKELTEKYPDFFTGKAILPTVSKDVAEAAIQKKITILPLSVDVTHRQDDEQITMQDLHDMNVKAVRQFINVLRDPKNVTPVPNSDTFNMTIAGLLINKETNWFYLLRSAFDDYGDYFNSVAAKRYKLPLGIYVPGNHAQLVTKGPFQKPGEAGWYIKIWDPMRNGTHEVALKQTYNDKTTMSQNLDRDNIIFNSSFAHQTINSPQENDLEALFNDPDLQPFAQELFHEKFAQRQVDSVNCIPYCFYIAAYLNALKKGDTPFKTEGLKQFEQDFGIHILTQEEFVEKLKKNNS